MVQLAYCRLTCFLDLAVGDSPQGSCTIRADLQTNVILLVKSILIEKYPERLAAPKAHALSPRSLEICRQFGLDTNLLRKIGTPRDEAYWVNFLVNLSRERIGTLPYERMDAAVLDCTPEVRSVQASEDERLMLISTR